MACRHGERIGQSGRGIRCGEAALRRSLSNRRANRVKVLVHDGVGIPRSTLAQWVGQTGVQLQSLVDALREAVLAQRVVHADETPVQMLAPGEKKTYRA